MINDKRGVIYTCMTGNYDKLSNHTCINSDWDYVCFTDDLSIKKEHLSWNIRPLVFNELDDIRNQRWHKLNPHILFPEYKNSIWIDSNINILKENLFIDVEKAIDKNSKISLMPHPERNCIYDEYVACVNFGKDDFNLMKRQIELIKKDGFPKGQGLFETGIIYRKHNDRRVIEVMEEWWSWIKEYSRRDQLSLTYILWKKKMKVDLLSDVSYRKNDGFDFIYKENHVTKEELIVRNKKLKIDIDALNDKINNLVNIINEMESSKFWKLRNIYLTIKKTWKKK